MASSARSLKRKRKSAQHQRAGRAGGRGRAPIVAPSVEQIVAGMARWCCTEREIADFLGVKKAVIRRRYHDVLIKARSDLKRKLRRAQIKLALSGNHTMLIWLGKQMLNQHEPYQEVRLRQLDSYTDAQLEAIARGGQLK